MLCKGGFIKTHKIVKVEWTDPANYSGWSKVTEAEDWDSMPCISSGILVKVKKGHIGITHSMDTQGKVAETMVIPRSAIRKIETIATFKS